MSELPRRSILERVLRSIPVLSYAARCIEEERAGELLMLFAVLLLAAVVSVLVWGYAALITIALSMVVLVGLIIIATTLG